MTRKGFSPLRTLMLLGLILLLLTAAYTLAPTITPHYELLRRLLQFAFAVWLLFFLAGGYKTILRLLAARPNPSGITLALVEQGTFPVLWSLYRRLSLRQMRLPVQMGFWALILFAIIAVVASTGKLDDTEVRWVHPDEIARPASTPDVTVFSLATGDNNITNYLRDLLQLVDTFKALGARVVVAERPWYYPELPRHRHLLDSIGKSGIAVLYDDQPSYGRLGFSEDSYSRTVDLKDTPPRMITTNIASNPPGTNPIYWFPTMYNGAWLMTSVSLVAVAKFQGEADTNAPHCLQGKVQLGRICIPVGSSGEALSFSAIPANNIMTGVVAYRDLDSTAMRFTTSADTAVLPNFPVNFAGSIRDKIVLISWSQSRSPWQTWPQAFVMQSIINGRLITKYDRLPLWLACAMIMLAGFLSLKLRPLIAAGIIVALGLAAYLISVWALAAHLLLLNMTYVSLAALLSALVFPLVRIAHEKG